MIAAHLPPDADYDAWRHKAREFLRAGLAPEEISWSDADDLFSAGGGANLDAPRINPTPSLQWEGE
jgi:hypothetical protein